MRWKRLLVIAALVIVALIVTGYAILISYDFNKLKPQIARAVKEATGRELKIGGDIKVKLGLSPAVLVEDIRFQNASWGSRPDLAKVKRMEMQIELFPLIRGDFNPYSFRQKIRFGVIGLLIYPGIVEGATPTSGIAPLLLFLSNP